MTTTPDHYLRTWIDQTVRPIIREVLRDELADILPALSLSPAPDADPYGDFNWLQATCTGVPASTLRIKSSKGEIPGVVKFGKRVLYEKAIVLNWLRSQTRQATPDAAELEQRAQQQISRQLAKSRKA